MRSLFIGLCVMVGLSSCEKSLPQAPSKTEAAEKHAPEGNQDNTPAVTIGKAVTTTEIAPAEEATAVKLAEALTATDLEEQKIQEDIRYFCTVKKNFANCEKEIRRRAAIAKELAKDVTIHCVTLESTLMGNPYRKVCEIKVGQMNQSCFTIVSNTEYPVECSFYKAIHDRIADLEK